MKKLFLIVLVIFSLFACSDDPKMELFSPEAFAYSLDNSWELNANVRVKGFSLEEQNDVFKAKLSYTVSLLKPDNKLLKQFDFGSIVEENEEEINELNIEIQAELDSTYSPGKYRLIFDVRDDNSGMKSKIEKEFEISK